MSDPRRVGRGDAPALDVEELAAQQGVQPIQSVADLRLGVFESNEEVEEFLAEVRRLRNVDLA